MKNNASIKAKEWFKIGDNEFGFAYSSLKDRHDKFYAQVCFMFHQSIEKYFKGYLVNSNIKFNKTHDLTYLCQQCEKVNKKFEKFIQECEIINQYYIKTRYPEHWSILRKEQAEEAYKTANKIILFIKKDLKL